MTQDAAKKPAADAKKPAATTKPAATPQADDDDVEGHGFMGGGKKGKQSGVTRKG